MDTPLLTPGEIRYGLNTIIFGKRDIVHYREIDSTNNRARDFADRDYPEGTLIVAEDQTAGRGRMGRRWHSPAGMGICMSIILRPKLSPGEAPLITLMTAVAVAETLSSLLQLNVRIKWPNDILVNDKKIAGILTEMNATRDSIHYIVLGLGMNVNTPIEILPDDISALATSVFIETGKPFKRAAIVRTFLEFFEHYYQLLHSEGSEPILHRWKEFSRIVGQRIRVDAVNDTFVGKVVDIDRSGVLLLEDETGKVQRIISGDVSLIQ
jgi:BirA family biotin operon repressor/biotin-[acetyl-CoA-carboxylase] ligase